MSNRIDFFGPEQMQLAVPAGKPQVFLEGRLCPFLEVSEIVRASDPGFGWARLTYNTAGLEGADVISPERIETIVPMGKSVSVRQLYNGGTGQSFVTELCIFSGHVESVDTEVGSKGRLVTIEARDISARLDRITVHGRRVATQGGNTLRLVGMEVVFNEDGEGNASVDRILHEGKSCKVFAADTRNAKFWSCAEVAVYLLSEYLPFGWVQIPDIELLEALMRNRVALELDVEGLSLLEALGRCCEQTQVKFRFEPRQEPNGPSQRIVFYRSGEGSKVELNCQRAGEQVSISRTNVWQLQSRRDYWPVTHRYIGCGDFKVYEATFDLVKAWDPGLEGGPQSDYSPVSNSDFDDVRDVYRKWCLNEAGDYTGSPYSHGEAFDFAKIFETDNYVQRRRSFQNALSTDSLGESLGYYLEVSYDDGAFWQEYTDSFDNLADECGIWLDSDTLSGDLWTAISAGTLKFRMTASVQSDERLSCEFADGPVNSAAEVVDHVISKPTAFQYRKVSGKSIFHNIASAAVGKPDEVDDTTALVDYIRNLSESNLAVIETIDVQTPLVAMNYEIGDRVIAGCDSRDILGIRGDSRSLFWVERVQMDFEKQSTDLRILRRRV